MNHNNLEAILILDFGSQYTQLIARRIRELNVYSEIVPYNITAEEILQKNPKGIIFSGGPASVNIGKSPVCDKNIFKLNLPVLGICYGMQLIGKLLGGKVESIGHKREYGRTQLIIIKKDIIFNNVPKNTIVWMSHSDHVLKLPPDFERIAYSQNSSIASMKHKSKKLYGIQFHPEVVHTEFGKQILKNFIYDICGCSGNWSIKSFVADTIQKLKEQLGNKEKVICAVSGGVDSTVLAVLLEKVIHQNLICIFVNNGLLRKNEPENVVKILKKYHINLRYINAEKQFLTKLRKVTDPEKKRKIIGREFISVFNHETEKLGNSIKYLAQGTLYPDVIESRSAFGGPSATIKTHHNVGGLPKRMKMKLIEPFRELFKDEVRMIGKELGLPDEIIWRQPFPGPGLAVRIIGEVTPERLHTLRESDYIITEEIKKANLYKTIWQSFGVLIPVKTVGVMGDERTYENVIAIRAVISSDGMTADWAKLPPELLGKISNRIINEVKGINRVVYDISSKPPSTIEWE